MGFISAGVVVLWHRLLLPAIPLSAPIPIYYRIRTRTPVPPTTTRQPVRGLGCAVYGPYYGARGGTAYNPTTAPGRRGALYTVRTAAPVRFRLTTRAPAAMPMAARSGARAGRVANADWYNARTGVTGSTAQNSNGLSAGDRRRCPCTDGQHAEPEQRARLGRFLQFHSGVEGAGVRGRRRQQRRCVKTAAARSTPVRMATSTRKTTVLGKVGGSGSWAPVQTPSRESRRHS